jgi:hypothetical protein
MPSVTADTLAKEPTTVRDRAVDAVRHATHVAHEARLLKTLASDAVEDGVHAAKRAITHGMHDLEDLRDSATYRIKRAPLMAVGLAFGAGLLFGTVCGRIGRSAVTRTR